MSSRSLERTLPVTLSSRLLRQRGSTLETVQVPHASSSHLARLHLQRVTTRPRCPGMELAEHGTTLPGAERHQRLPRPPNSLLLSPASSTQELKHKPTPQHKLPGHLMVRYFSLRGTHDASLILPGLKHPWNSSNLINRNLLAQNISTCRNLVLDFTRTWENGLFRQKG